MVQSAPVFLVWGFVFVFFCLFAFVFQENLKICIFLYSLLTWQVWLEAISQLSTGDHGPPSLPLLPGQGKLLKTVCVYVCPQMRGGACVLLTHAGGYAGMLGRQEKVCRQERRAGPKKNLASGLGCGWGSVGRALAWCTQRPVFHGQYRTN